MRRSGTVWPWMLLLFGSACGDAVVVARGISLVSAESTDAGLGDAGVGPHFDIGHGPAEHHLPLLPSPPPSANHSPLDPDGAGGTGSSSDGAGGSTTDGAGGSAGSTKHH